MAMVGVDVDVDMDRVAQVRAILGTETISDTIDAALCEVIRRSAGQKLAALAKGGAAAALLEPAAEDRMWPPAWFAVAPGDGTDVGARSEEFLAEGFGE